MTTSDDILFARAAEESKSSTLVLDESIWGNAVIELPFFEVLPDPELITDEGSVFMGEESKITGTYRMGHEAHLGIQVLISQPGGKEGFPCKAAIDTGAVRSCISSRVANVLGLPSVGKSPIQTATGMTTTDLRVGNIIIGDRIIEHVPFLESEPFANYDVIIGMDLIGFGSLKTYKHENGVGTFEFEI